ncbi:hypothetical protein HN873_012651 [Arachis hypogaea]|nr:ABC transporter C family member [Arachis hypogaea]
MWMNFGAGFDGVKIEIASLVGRMTMTNSCKEQIAPRNLLSSLLLSHFFCFQIKLTYVLLVNAGAMTIRAFEEEGRFFKKNLDLIDVNASPFFYSFTSNEWLIQRLETISANVLSAVALCMVVLPPETFLAGFIGMALSYGLSLNNSLVFSIQFQCTLANYIVFVERINQYMYIPSEATEVIEGNHPLVN